MKVVIQRVSEAKVTISGVIHGSIQQGLLLLVGISPEDTQEDIIWMIRKIINMRIFGDDKGHMNLSIQDIGGSILVISQFTLYASTKKGNRPSFINAAKPKVAIPLYEHFIDQLKTTTIPIATGVFGADMKVSLVNDGPVTIIMDSNNKE